MRLTSLRPRFSTLGITRKLILINALIFPIVIALTAVSILTTNVLSGLRAYVQGEGLYAKYQKDAVFFLQLYLTSGVERDYQNFLSDIKVPLGDGMARRELQKPVPDRKLAAVYFAQGKNSAEDIPRLIALFVHFHDLGFVSQAIRLWTAGDLRIDALVRVASQAHESLSAGRLSAPDKNAIVSQIIALNGQLIVLENDFSRTLGEGAVRTAHVLTAGLLGMDALIVLAGLLLSRGIGRSIVSDVRKLSEGANRIGQGDLSVRIDIKSGDELGQLAARFNQMASSIEHARTELVYARDAALSASRVKSEFLANMSHEIRTPLNVLLGLTEVVGESLRKSRDETTKGHLDTIQTAGRRLLTTLQGILDFSKMEADSFELRPESIVLPVLIENQVAEQRSFADQKGLELTAVVEVPDATVTCDEYCLSNALNNLINNAIKFTQKGTVTVRLYRGDDGLIRIDVRDTGVGIDEAYFSRLFEPFSQESSGLTRRFEGSGLGLALTRRYLELNGVQLAAQSRKGEGSCFTVLFPHDCEVRPLAGTQRGIADAPSSRRLS